MNEEWKDIKQLDGEYQVSNLGRIKRVKPCSSRGCTTRCRHLNTILKLETHVNGYMVFRIKSRKVRFRVHRLVAEAFIPNLSIKPEVNHRDGNPKNNHVNNLEWVTSEENNKWNDYLAFERVLSIVTIDQTLKDQLKSKAFTTLAPTGRV